MCVCVCLVEAQETNTKAECLRCSIRENMSGIAGLFKKKSFGHALSGGVQNRKDRRVKARPTHPHSHVSVINFHVV